MNIKTERLAIKEFSRDMAMAVHKNSLDEDTRRFLPDEVFETVEDAEETIDFLMSQYGGTDGPLVYPVLLRDDTNIGYVQAVPIEDGDWEIGYHIGKAYTCKGYATEAVKAFLPVIMSDLNIRKISGICVKENIASCKVLEKAGFTLVYEGIGFYQGEEREIHKYAFESKMRILVLNGSPKKKSDTFRLTDAFLKGMNKKKENTVDVINVIEKDIAPCRGCFGCWAKMDGHCIIRDDQNEILDLYTKADVIIWSFPLYCYSMPSHLKAVLDRTIPLVKMRMVEESDGTVHHEALVDFSRIHTLVICGCGFPDWDGNFDAMKLMCKTCFGDPEIVCVPEAPLLNIPEAAVAADPLLKSFEAAGEEYADCLKLSPKTKTILETPMITKEEYLKGVNG